MISRFLLFGLFIIMVFRWESSFAQKSPHIRLNFPCETCHNTQQWDSVRFNHEQTKFPLTGQHVKLDCKDCHNLKNFSDVIPACNSCHTDIHHDRLYPDCDRCHTTQNWILLDFYKAHASTSMPILGSHAQLDCQACHRGAVDGEWRRLRSNCYDCHRTDYLSAQNPVHSDLNFGLICEDCHSQISWNPALFQKHDSQHFPIYTGDHKGEWENCTTCHFNNGNYTTFSCFLNCHEHNQSETDSKHHEVSGYRYDSNACYSCHRNGKGED